MPAEDVCSVRELAHARALLVEVRGQPGGARAIASLAAKPAVPFEDRTEALEAAARLLVAGSLVAVRIYEVPREPLVALVQASDVDRFANLEWAQRVLERACEDLRSAEEILGLARHIAPHHEFGLATAIDLVASWMPGGFYVLVRLRDELGLGLGASDQHERPEIDPGQPAPPLLSELIGKEPQPELTWIEIRVIDQFEQPLPRMRATLARSDRRRTDAPLDDKAELRVDPLFAPGLSALVLRSLPAKSGTR